MVVEDERPVQDLLVTWLDEAGYSACSASNGVEGLRELYQQRPDLVVIDILMPKMDGYELCKLVREISPAPIMILSALGNESDKVKGLELGADDFVVKPVGMEEFLARIEALLRRARLSGSLPQPKDLGYSDDYLSIDVTRHEVKVRGKPIDLTPVEFRLLDYLTQLAGHTCQLDEIRQDVWESRHYSAEVVRWHIASLRSKIERDPRNPQRIVTIWGVGYRYDISGSPLAEINVR